MQSPSAAGPELFYLQQVLQGHSIETDQDRAMKEKTDEKVRKWLTTASKNVDLDMKSHTPIACILLDILLYEDSVLVNTAFTLLTDYFQQKRAIITSAKVVGLLDKQAVAILRKVRETLAEAHRHLNDDWLRQPDEDALVKTMIFINNLEILQDLCIYDPNRVIHTDDKKKYDLLNTDMLKEDWDNEDNKIIDEDQLNDQKNQTLMRNLKAYEVPMTIIRLHGLEDADDSNSYLRVLEKCYIFLLKFVRNNA